MESAQDMSDVRMVPEKVRLDIVIRDRISRDEVVDIYDAMNVFASALHEDKYDIRMISASRYTEELEKSTRPRLGLPNSG